MKITELTNRIGYHDIMNYYGNVIQEMVDKNQKGHKHYRKMKNGFEALVSSKEPTAEQFDLCFLKALVGIVKACKKNEGEVAKVITTELPFRKDALIDLYKAQYHDR